MIVYHRVLVSNILGKLTLDVEILSTHMYKPFITSYVRMISTLTLDVDTPLLLGVHFDIPSSYTHSAPRSSDHNPKYHCFLHNRVPGSMGQFLIIPNDQTIYIYYIYIYIYYTFIHVYNFIYIYMYIK